MPDGQIVRLSTDHGHGELILSEKVLHDPAYTESTIEFSDPQRIEPGEGLYRVYNKQVQYQSSGFDHVRLSEGAGERALYGDSPRSLSEDRPSEPGITSFGEGPEPRPSEPEWRETELKVLRSIDPQVNYDAESLTSVDIASYFTQPEGAGKLSFSAQGLPPGMTMDPRTGVISGTFDGSSSQGANEGVYRVTVTATPEFGSSISQSFDWTVINVPPVAVNDQEATDSEVVLQVPAAAGLLGNDHAPDGDSIEVVAVNQIQPGVLSGSGATPSSSGVGAALPGSHGGIFIIHADGSYSFDPNGEFGYLGDSESARTSIDYVISDGEGGTATATLTITVTGGNDAPQASGSIPDQTDVDDVTITDLDVSGYFTDADASDTLTYTASGLPDGLTLDSATGRITGTPVPSASQGGSNGVYQVTITAEDSQGATVDQTFTWTVTNPAPVAADDTGTTDQDSELNMDAASGVLANDADPDGDVLSVTGITNGSVTVYPGSPLSGDNGGEFTLNADGSYTFNPNGAFDHLAVGESAQTSIQYTVDDGEGGTDTATLTVTVTGTNEAPETSGSIPNQTDVDDVTITDLDVSGYFTDGDTSDTLTYSASGLPDGLTLDEATGRITGTPAPSASQGGTNGVHQVTITATDSQGATVDQTFTWTVTNPAPVAADDTGTTDQDSELNMDAASGVLANDADPDGDVLSVTGITNGSVTVYPGSPLSGDNGGEFTLNADGSYTFNPNGAFDHLAVGESAQTSIQYTVDDGEGGTDTATLTVTVTGTNEAPETSGSIPKQTDVDDVTITDLDVSGYFTDADASDTLTYSVSGLPDGLTLDTATGRITGTPAPSASQHGPAGDGVYQVTITAKDSQGATVDQTFTWTVTNPAPVAADDTGTTDQDSELNMDAASGVLANDADPDGDALTVSAVDGNASQVGTAVAGDNGGKFTLNADGSYTFNPNGAFDHLAVGESAQTSIQYTVDDGEGGTDTATLTVTVTGTNEAPETSGSIPKQTDVDDVTITDLDVSGYFTDGDTSDTLTYSASGLPDGLTLDTATGRITGTPAPSASQHGPAGDGVYQVTITAEDSQGATVDQTFTWTVTNPAPVAADDAGNVSGNDPLVKGVVDGLLSNDHDPDGDALSVTGVASNNSPGNTASDDGSGTLTIVGEYGSLEVRPDGSYTYQRSPGSPGGVQDVFTYTIDDGEGGTDTATLTIGLPDGVPSAEIPSSGGVSTTVYESGLSAGTESGSGKETASGTIRFTSPDGVASISLGGHSLTDVDQSFSDGLTARYSYDPATGEGIVHYSYTLRDPTTGDNNQVRFDLEIEDQDGDALPSGQLVIDIVDDAPQAVNDTASVTEGDTFTVDPSTGVLANDLAGADGWDSAGSVVGVASGDTGTASTGGVGTVITGAYGTLTLQPDGSYTYKAHPDSITADAQDVFTYTVRDADGDETTATLTINVADVTVDSDETTGVVYEAGLSTGTASGDGTDTIFRAPLELQNGWTVVSETSGPGENGFGQFTIHSDGTFSYTLNGATTDVAGADETDRFTYTVTDAYGNTVENTVVVQIVDDRPVITVDNGQLGALEVDESGLDTGPVYANDPNFVTGVFGVNYGADGDAGTTYLLKAGSEGIDSGLVDTATGQSIYLYTENGVVVGRIGASGSADPAGTKALDIAINAVTGEVELTQHRPVSHPVAGDTASAHDDSVRLANDSVKLVANATDGDGDTTASDEVSVGGQFQFRDDGPEVNGEPSAATVAEEGLPTGSVADGSGLVATGTLPASFGEDGEGSLVFTQNQGSLRSWLDATGNSDLTITVVDGVLTASRGADEIFVVTLDPAGPSYHFELKGAMNHPDSAQDHQLRFEYEAQDGDGDTAEGYFQVNVVDDTPRTEYEIVTPEDTAFGPFTTSADASLDKIEIQDASGATVTGTDNGDGTKTFDVGHGTLTVDQDGKITYTPDQNYSNRGSSDGFKVVVVDDSGNSTTTDVSVTVIPVADAPTVVVDSPDVPTLEDEPATLGLKAPEVTDNSDQNTGLGDSPERLGEITLSGFPEGAQLLASDGTTVLHTFGPGGSVTVVLTDGSHVTGAAGDLSMTQADFEGLQVLPPEHRHENFEITVSATSYEVDENGDRLYELDGGGNSTGTLIPGASSSASVNVQVQAVTDDAALVFDTSKGASAVTGVDDIVYGGANGNTKATITVEEDSSFNVKQVLEASFQDLDGSEARSITIENTTGSSILVDGTELAPGASTTIQATGQTGGIDSFPDIEIGPAADFSGDLDGITVTINAQDKDGDGFDGGVPGSDGVAEADLTNNSVVIDLKVNPKGGDVAVTDVETPEDTAVAFLSGVRVTDTGTGAEVINSIEFVVPAGWEVVAPPASGGWSVTGDGSGGSTYRIEFDDNPGTALSEADREAILDGFMITPPPHSSLDQTIDLSITTTDTQTVNGVAEKSDPETVSLPVKVVVTPVAEIVDSGAAGDTDGDGNPDLTMTPGHDYTTPGEEDVPFNLGLENGFSLEAGWANQDGDEAVFARVTPKLIDENGHETDGLGSRFEYTDGSGKTVSLTFTGDPLDIPVESLDSLTFLAPPNVSGMFRIQVEAVTQDTDPDTGEVVEAVSGDALLTNVLIKPSADTVTTTLTARVTGNEDEAMDLSIRPKSSDPSETFNVTISGVPEGATLTYDGQELFPGSTGLPSGIVIVDNGDGTWRAEIEGFDPKLGEAMKVQPPEHSNDPFTLNVSTVSVDSVTLPDGSVETDVSDPFDLTIEVTPKGVADSADIQVKPVSEQAFTEAGVESAGGVFLRDLLNKAELVDQDGSEVLSFRIGNLNPDFGIEGDGVVYLGNGEWSFSKAALDNLGPDGIRITTPPNFSGSTDFTLYSVTTEDDGDSLTEEHAVKVEIAPSPEAGMNLSTSAAEDTATLVDFGIQHQNGDTDEVLASVWISAADVDSALNYSLTIDGQSLADAAADAGMPGIILEDGWYKLDDSLLGNVHLQGAPNWHGTADFGVRYEVKDPSTDGSVAATVEESPDYRYEIEVVPVTDQPVLAVDGSSDLTMTAPGLVSFDLDMGNAGRDYDGSEHLIRVLLDNVPPGVMVENADFIGNGQWLLITDASVGSNASHTVTLRVPGEAGGLVGVPIGVTITTEDAGNGQPLTASTSVTLTTDFIGTGQPDMPAEILNWEQTTFSPTEDTEFLLQDLMNGQIADGVPGNEFNITLSGLPAGTEVTGMTSTVINGQTVWTVSGQSNNADLQDLLNQIRITPPEDWNSNKGDFRFDAKLTTYIPDGYSREEETPIISQVTPVSDPVDITINAPDVTEGSDLEFRIQLDNAADNPDWSLVDGKLYLQLDEGGMPATGTLTDANGNPLMKTTVSGVAGVPDGEYYVIEGVDPSTGAVIRYSPSGPYVSGSVDLSAWAQGQENGAANVATGSVTETGHVVPVNSGYDVQVSDVSGQENPDQQAAPDKSNVIALNIGGSGLQDTDGSEDIGTVLLKNLPKGFLVFVGDSAADASLAELSNNAGGDGVTNTWLLGDGSVPAYVGIMPPKNWSGTLSDLIVQVLSGEVSLDNQLVSEDRFDLVVTPVADGVTINPTPSFGDEGDIIGLNLNHELVDPVSVGATDQSTETLTLELRGLGEHAAFYLGNTLLNDPAAVAYDAATDTYTIRGLTSKQAEELGFVQAKSDMGNLEVRAQTEESANGATSDWTNWESVVTDITSQFGTTGNDQLLFTGALVDGRSGDDVVALRLGEDVDGATLAGTLKNIETLDLGIDGANEVSALRLEDVIAITDEDNTLSILGDADDSVTLSGGWTKGTTTDGLVTYTMAGESAELKIMESVSVIIE
nr:Ig-like domain-containing protein [Marinobacter daepoensis]